MGKEINKNNNYNAQHGCIKTQWESYWLAMVEGEFILLNSTTVLHLANQILRASVSFTSEPFNQRSSSLPYPTQRTR